MYRKTFVNITVAAVILAGGCAVSQIHTKDAPRRAELAQPSMPETVLENVKLNEGRKVQNLVGMIGRTNRLTHALVNDFEGKGASLATTTTTVGALKGEGLFKGSYLSDDSTVIFVDAKGGFVQREMLGGQQRAFNYRRLVAMFNPADGELISYGLVP